MCIRDSFESVPWEELGHGLRRRVLFTDRLTMVLLEIRTVPDAAPVKTHYHPHDQITYVLEGEALVHLDGQELEVGPGGAYCVPSNVHHGLKPLSDKVVIVDCFTPTREDFRTKLVANDIRAFVYTWFGLLDKAAPFVALSRHLDRSRLEMNFPRTEPIRNFFEFQSWWEKVPKGEHRVGNIEVKELTNMRYRVNLNVSWSPKGGEWQDFTQEWIVESESGAPKISSYSVHPLQDEL